jgi:hypothetical protein
MKHKQLARAAGETIALAAVLASRLPAGCAVPPEDLFAAMWPLGCRPVTLERRSRRDRKAARAYARLRAEVDEMLRTRPDAPAPLAALLRTIPLDPAHWRTALVPGVPAEALEAA